MVFRYRRVFQGEPQIGVDPTGTPHSENALILGVDIQENLPFYESGLERVGAGQARFLIHGEQQFQWRMGEIVLRSHNQSHGNGDSVIRSKSGFIRSQPISFENEFYGIF